MLAAPGVLTRGRGRGPAVGAGFQLALACDLRVAADDAVFRMAETGLGLVPDLAGTGPLVRAVGEQAALEICLTGRDVRADEALRLGLVRAVVPADELEQACDDLLGAVLAAPEPAVRETLDLLRGAGGRAPAEQQRLEREAQARLLTARAAGAPRRRALTRADETPGRYPVSTPGGMRAARSYARDPSVARRGVDRSTWRRIATYAGRYKVAVVVFLVLTGMAAGLWSSPPLLLQRLVDDGVADADRGLVLALAGISVAVAARRGRGHPGPALAEQPDREGLIYDLRTQVFDHVQSQPIAFFTRTQTGSLVSRLNNDVIGAQRAFTTVLSGVVSNVVSVVAVVVVMVTLSWQITLASLLLVPVFLVPARLVGRRLQALTRESFQLNAELGNRMTERFNVGGALLVRLLGVPATESREYAERAERVRDVGVRIAMANRFFVVALGLVAALATALTYGAGGLLAIDGRLTVGTLLALTALLGRLYGPLTALSNVRIDVMTAVVSFERVFEVLDLPPLVREAEHPVRLPAGPLEVRLEHVTFAYPRASEVSLPSLEAPGRGRHPRRPARAGRPRPRVPAGSTVALVGPSGAGKTTLTGLVSRLHDATQGRVLLGGTDVRQVATTSLRQAVGVSARTPTCSTTPCGPTCCTPTPAPRRTGCGRRWPTRRSRPRPRPARRPRHPGRRPRAPAVRRGEAAHRHRPAAAARPGRRRPRRGHGPPGLPLRGGRAGGAAPHPGRAHRAGRGPPAEHGPRRRPRRGHGRRPGGRAGHARGAARPRRALRPAVPHPAAGRRRRRRGAVATADEGGRRPGRPGARAHGERVRPPSTATAVPVT